MAQLIFGHLAAGQEDAFNPVPFFKTYRDFDGSQLNVREHQDADEFFTRLQVPSSPQTGPSVSGGQS